VQVNSATFEFRRINPFHGLMIDGAVWRDAHEYHRDQLRLHHLALHGWGILQGLDVSVGDEENILLIEPGIAIDPAGTFIIVGQRLSYHLTSRDPGTKYLVIQFRDVPSGPNQPGVDGVGQPTRLLEAYRIEERDDLPVDPYLELARFEWDARGPIRAPRNQERPERNELDIRSRIALGSGEVVLRPSVELTEAQPAPRTAAQEEAAVAGSVPSVASTEADGVPPTAQPAASPGIRPLQLAVAAHGGDGWDRHTAGIRLFARQFRTAAGQGAEIVPSLSPAQAEQADILYLVGQSAVNIAARDLTGIRRLLDKGGVVVGEGCADGPKGDAGAREFALAYSELADKLGRRLTKIDRGHALLLAEHVFAEPPVGGRSSQVVLEDNGMVYSDADYGCAWEGGASQQLLPRAAIRDAVEFGVNIAVYRNGHPAQS
jgi:hypothetical protein